MINQKSNIQWDMYEACACIEEFSEEEHTAEEKLEAMAYLISTGLVWKLQGSYGRSAVRLIESGLVSEKGQIDWEKVLETEIS